MANKKDGIYFKATQKPYPGTIVLFEEIESVATKATTSGSNVKIQLEFLIKNASIEKDYDVDTIEEKEVFIEIDSNANIILNGGAETITFDSLSGSGGFANADISFKIRAKGGKIGGPGFENFTKKKA
ncbi:MAG: hypothetical protein ABIN36_07115 [Ferruginibacter sp.]